ncbi:hypothetical protein HDU92_001539, partial [Lobulomyces angularis]
KKPMKTQQLINTSLSQPDFFTVSEIVHIDSNPPKTSYVTINVVSKIGVLGLKIILSLEFSK